MAKSIKKTATTTQTPKPPTERKTAAKSCTHVLPTETQIRARAYEIYLRRNGGSGDPAADWARAEQQLIAELNK